MTQETIGFGVSTKWDLPHHWIVQIPKERDAPVVLLEDYGRNGWSSRLYDPVVRATMPREVWKVLADPIRRHLNERLKDAGFKGSKWTAGGAQVERVLGQELCLLFWTVDDATEAEGREAFASFRSYMPCEIRCLEQYARRDPPGRGWRSAIKAAFIPSRTMKE